MRILSRAEEIIGVTILKLGDNAYGVSIREQIEADTGKLWSFASIYQPLDKLVRKEYVTKIKGEPSVGRGGKCKFYYQVTDEGKQALLDVRRTQEQIWKGVLESIPEPGIS